MTYINKVGTFFRTNLESRNDTENQCSCQSKVLKFSGLVSLVNFKEWSPTRTKSELSEERGPPHTMTVRNSGLKERVSDRRESRKISSRHSLTRSDSVTTSRLDVTMGDNLRTND